MSIELPEPSENDDIWGQELNAAIQSVKATSDAAAAAAATNVSINALDAVGNPILSYGNTSVTAIATTALGAPNGIPTLDSARKVPVEQLGNLGYADVGAAAASHQHALTDIPQAQIAIDASPAFAIFNTVTGAWPRRVDITASPKRTVIYWGDAALPPDAKPGIDLYFGPKTSGATNNTPVTVPDPTPTPDPVTGVVMSTPTIAVAGSQFTITATFTNGSTATTYAWIQLAVRGPNGELQDCGYNTNVALTSGQVLTVTGTGNAASTGTWTTYLAQNQTGGTAQTNWVNGPAATFSIAATGGVGGSTGTGTPGSGSVPLLNLSGLSWNSGVCDKSNSVEGAKSFGDWRGRPIDSFMFFTGRGSTNEMAFIPDAATSFKGYRVVAQPFAPEHQNISTAAVAGGAMDAFWVQWGKDIVAKGWNDGRTILRLAWECNGDWYEWSWVKSGAANFVNAWKRTVNNIRAGGANKVKFDLCMNKGNVNGGIDWQSQIADPLIGYIDIIGLDWYDFAPGEVNSSQFNAQANANPGFNPIATYCRAKGLKMSIDEWGVCTNVNGFGAGGDNPFYIQSMKAIMAANTDVFINDMYFNVNGGEGLEQQIWPVDTKPNSSAFYKSPSGFGR
jgi:hypothetical protein